MIQNLPYRCGQTLDSLSFLHLQDMQCSFYIWNLSPPEKSRLKASLASMHITTFILRSLNLEWQEKESIICSGLSITCSEVYFQHRWNLSPTHDRSILRDRELKRSLNSFTSIMKKKMSNIIYNPLAERHIRWKIIIQFLIFF